MTRPTLVVLAASDAPCALAVIRAAFAAQSAPTDPPSAALAETAATIAAQIAPAGHGGGAFGLRMGEALVAVVLWRAHGSGLYLGRLAVHPAWRRQGLARALIAAVEAEAVRQGRTTLHLGARLALADNRALFAACGFVETGLETHPGYDAPTSVTMEKRLSTPLSAAPARSRDPGPL